MSVRYFMVSLPLQSSARGLVPSTIRRATGAGIDTSEGSAMGARRPSGMALNAVMQLNQTILEALGRAQIQRHMAVTRRNQWNAVPDEYRDHTDHELIDRLLVEKGGDELAAPHQPDVLARLLFQAM